MTTLKDTKMELNKMSVSIISILITLAISFGGFCYQIGSYTTEIKNLKETVIVNKKDLKEEIEKVDKNKADKEIVNLIFQKINKIDGKLDRLIMTKRN